MADMGCSQDKIRFDYEMIAETRKMKHFIFKVPNAVGFSQVTKARLYLECVGTKIWYKNRTAND